MYVYICTYIYVRIYMCVYIYIYIYIYILFYSFSIDSTPHTKVCNALTNKRLIEGIKKASPLAQTSCLEGFHSVLNHFSPKMIAYCYVGQYCRLEMNFIVSLLTGIKTSIFT